MMSRFRISKERQTDWFTSASDLSETTQLIGGLWNLLSSHLITIKSHSGFVLPLTCLYLEHMIADR